MPTAEQSIRNLIATWLRATAAGDIAQILPLMAEDVVFLQPGQPPMRGREAFAAGFQTALQHVQIEANAAIQEIQVFGDWAYCWNHLTVKMTPRQGGAPKQHRGNVLTVLRKEPDGRWAIFRDANMLTAET